MEDKQEEIKQEEVGVKKSGQRKRPLGVLILGGINCFFGLLLLVASISNYMSATPEDLDKMVELLENQIGQLKENQNLPEFGHQQIKAALIIQAAVFFVFFLTGLGILLRINWVRKLTIYSSFLWIFLTIIPIIRNFSLIKYSFFQIIYPIILIRYFTNKEVESYFKQ